VHTQETNESFYDKAKDFFSIYVDPILISLGILFVLLVAYLNFSSEAFLSTRNLTNILNNMVVMGFLALGQSLVILTKNLDLSVGSILGLTAVFLATIFNLNVPVILMVPLALLFGAFLGFLNGFIVTKIGINAIITTLGSMSIFRGLAYLIGEGNPTRINHSGYGQLGRYLLAGFVPLSIVLLVLFLLFFYIILKYTQFGRNLFTVGSNIEGSHYIGIGVGSYQLYSFVICGLMAAAGAVITTSQLGAGLPDMGTGIELEVITATILGGVSLKGGKCNLFGVILAVALLAVISNGLVLLGIPIHWRRVVRGVLLIIAVTIDVIYKRNRKYNFNF